MSHRPYKPTQILRTTVSQEARIVLPPETDAPPGSYRDVEVVVPESPRVAGILDVTPEQIGYNREYKVPVLGPGAQIRFSILPDQFFTAVSNTKYAELTIIVQHYIDPRFAKNG